MRIKMKGMFLSCCLATACAGAGPDVTAQNEPKQLEAENQATLTDGVYSIRQIAESEGEIVDIQADELVVPALSYEETVYLLIGKTPDVLFNLKQPATKTTINKDNFSIHLKFDDESSEKLFLLTKDLAEIGGYIANVIGGELVSYHRIQEEIPDGVVKVTCCDPSACERLMEALDGRKL